MSPRSSFPGMPLGWAVVFSALAAQAAPPADVTVPQWADQHRKIAAETGARKTGDWVTATAPYLYRPMLVAGVDHPAPSAWMRSSAKVGKTQVALNAMMHCVDTAPRSMMVVLPKSDKVTDFNTKVWEPTLEATQRVALKVMGAKSRSRAGSNKKIKRFRGGYMTFANAQVESELQSDDIGFLLFEEPSSYPNDTGGRGHPVDQARSRQDAWADDAKEYGSGTPAFVGDCRVTFEVERRTQEKYYLPCPHCGALQLLQWENRTTYEGRPHFVCQSKTCGALIGHEHKLDMLAQAHALELEGRAGYLACFISEDPDNPTPPSCIEPEDWDAWYAVRGPEVGSKLEGRDPSFDGIWQAYSPFTTWARIWQKFEDANTSGDPEDLVTFWQQVLGRPFEAAYERPNNEGLFDSRQDVGRIAQLSRGVIPPWAWALVGSADVQGDRIEWAAYAVGPDRRMARIDGGVIPIPPADPRCWAELGEITRRTWSGPHIQPIGFDRFGVDTGGHHTNQAYVFCAGRPNVMALKGSRNREALPVELGSRRKAKIGRSIIASIQLYLVGTHRVKKDVYFGLAQTLASTEQGVVLPGAFMLEPEATEQDFAQLTAEVLLPRDPAKGRKEETWEPVKGVRNEQLDLAVYGWAMAWSFLPDSMSDKDWDRLIAARRRDPATVDAHPLERLWSDAPGGAPPAAAGESPAAVTPPPSPSAAGAAPAPNPMAEHPLLRMARRATGGDA